jgi:hypothetical protein
MTKPALFCFKIVLLRITTQQPIADVSAGPRDRSVYIAICPRPVAISKASQASQHPNVQSAAFP